MMATIEHAEWLLPLLFIPSAILGMATAFYYRQPKKINSWYGYRTPSSMKNQDTWTVANQISTAWLLYTSLIFLVVLLTIVLGLGKAGIINWFGSVKVFFFIVTGLSTVLTLVPIVITEYKLKVIFTSNGIRKES